MARWEEIAEPVLRWVQRYPSFLSEPLLLTLAITEPTPFEDIEGLDSRQVNDALKRLQSRGLISGEMDHFGRDVIWGKLRLTADGLRLLDEWPDLEKIEAASALGAVLEQLATTAPHEDATALRRTEAYVARTSGELIRDAVSELTADAVKDIAE
jgi:DNA-binding PadR family transcriptional regulator